MSKRNVGGTEIYTAERHQKPTHRELRTFKYKTEAISESVTLFAHESLITRKEREFHVVCRR